MIIKQDISLLPYNTFNIDVKADWLIEYDSENDLQSALELEFVKNKPLLAIGGGSNILFINNFKGIILHSTIKTIDIEKEDDNYIFVKAGSGVVWDNFVEYCVSRNWSGLENLSLIPGEVGASAVQNIGAYGVEAKDCIYQVNTVEISTGKLRSFTNVECNYGYRESIFKNELNEKYIITSVIYRLNKKPQYKLNYQDLESAVIRNGEINLQNIRRTIISIRQNKLPDTNILGNAGSYFKNPIVDKEMFLSLQKKHAQIPHYFVSETEEKLSAAWLIDQCGWKGKNIGNAAVHDKQALVLVNRGGASGSEISFLAEQIQQSVFLKFGIKLHPEVIYIKSNT